MTVLDFTCLKTLAVPYLETAVKMYPGFANNLTVIDGQVNVIIDNYVHLIKEVSAIISCEYTTGYTFFGLANREEFDVISDSLKSLDIQLARLRALHVRAEKTKIFYTPQQKSVEPKLFLTVFRPQPRIFCMLLVAISSLDKIDILGSLAIPKDDTLWLKYYWTAYFFTTIRDWLDTQEKRKLRDKGHRSIAKHMKI